MSTAELPQSQIKQCNTIELQPAVCLPHTPEALYAINSAIAAQRERLTDELAMDNSDGGGAQAVNDAYRFVVSLLGKCLTNPNVETAQSIKGVGDEVLAHMQSPEFRDPTADWTDLIYVNMLDRGRKALDGTAQAASLETTRHRHVAKRRDKTMRPLLRGVELQACYPVEVTAAVEVELPAAVAEIARRALELSIEDAVDPEAPQTQVYREAAGWVAVHSPPTGRHALIEQPARQPADV